MHITVLSKITLYSGEKGRKTAIVSGYQPLFNFADAPTIISGNIDLMETPELKPGMSAVVSINFLKGFISEKYFVAGERFTFAESLQALGEGEIMQVTIQ